MTRAITMAAALTLALLAAAPARAAAQADSGVELGFRLGYAFSAGHLGAPPNGTDNPLGDYVGGQIPIWFDAGYRFNQLAYLGAYLSYGFGVVNDDRQNLCRNANVDCSASDFRLGLMGRLHLPPIAMLSPWLGLGFGYEWGSFSFQQSAIGATNTDYGWSGWEFANLQAGADFRVAQKVTIAPFVSVSFGQFESTSTTLATANSKNTTDQDLAKTSWHEWILIGVRVAFAP
jgi:opacity protein-like surface antigen